MPPCVGIVCIWKHTQERRTIENLADGQEVHEVPLCVGIQCLHSSAMVGTTFGRSQLLQDWSLCCNRGVCVVAVVAKEVETYVSCQWSNKASLLLLLFILEIYPSLHAMASMFWKLLKCWSWNCRISWFWHFKMFVFCNTAMLEPDTGHLLPPKQMNE